MNLNDAQKTAVIAWINQGLTLAQIQKRLESEFGLRLTYMEARLLMGDLSLVPKDPPPAQAPAVLPGGTNPNPPAAGRAAAPPPTAPADPAGVRVKVDSLARAGAVVSGQVTFSDGQTAAWQIDQMGRLGLSASKPGYRPPAEDVAEFQALLENELAKLGL